MLILSRKIGESIVIGDRIVVRVMGVKGNPKHDGEIVLGFEAPADVPVMRQELEVLEPAKPKPTIPPPPAPPIGYL